MGAWGHGCVGVQGQGGLGGYSPSWWHGDIVRHHYCMRCQLVNLLLPAFWEAGRFKSKGQFMPQRPHWKGIMRPPHLSCQSVARSWTSARRGARYTICIQCTQTTIKPGEQAEAEAEATAEAKRQTECVNKKHAGRDRDSKTETETANELVAVWFSNPVQARVCDRACISPPPLDHPVKSCIGLMRTTSVGESCAPNQTRKAGSPPLRLAPRCPAPLKVFGTAAVPEHEQVVALKANFMQAIEPTTSGHDWVLTPLEWAYHGKLHDPCLACACGGCHHLRTDIRKADIRVGAMGYQ